MRARLADWSRELHALCGGRVPLAQDLHLTLAFLGQVPERRVGEVERAAGEVSAQAATLVLDRPGFWKHNRIAWAGASSAGKLRGSRASRSRLTCGTKGFGSKAMRKRSSASRSPRARLSSSAGTLEAPAQAMRLCFQKPGRSRTSVAAFADTSPAARSTSPTLPSGT